MAINASAGAKIYIGPVTAAANAAAYAALSWVEIGSTESIPEFGDSSQVITWLGLSEARVRKFKGARDAGDLGILCAADPTDPGQIAVIAAEKTKFSYAIKIVLEDSADANDTDSIFYFHAKIMAVPLNVGGANDVTKRTFNLAIDTQIIEVPSTVVP